MGRGPTVANKKEASAKAKGKIYSLHAKLISMAAEKGADPALNPSLVDAIYTAKKDGVTTDVIDRAIQRGAGLDKDARKVEAIYYEGYAPGGIALIVRALTDNRNRTAPSIRHIFSAGGGSLGETGSVSSFLFDYHGVIEISTTDLDLDSLESTLLETSALDYHIEGDRVEIITDRTHLSETTKLLQSAGFIPLSSSMQYRPKDYIEVTDIDTVLRIYTILAGFDEDEDVETVWNNAHISDPLWQEAEIMMEKKRFRT